MSMDRILLLKKEKVLAAYQIVTDYGSFQITPIAALRLRRLFNKILPPDDALPADDDPAEGLLVKGQLL
jgi:hypothetical protein